MEREESSVIGNSQLCAMHITKVELKNFKRFTDLTIDSIPADAKLILLIGSNGSGKSAVFDAFEIDNSNKKILPFSANDSSSRRMNIMQERTAVNQRLANHKKVSSDTDEPFINTTTKIY